MRTTAASHKVLAPGEFIGTVKTLTTPGGSVSLCGPSPAMKRHCHSDAHFVHAPAGPYETTVAGRRDRLGPGVVIFNPPGTEHSDRYLGVDLFTSFSLDDALVRDIQLYAYLPDRSALFEDPRIATLMSLVGNEVQHADAVSPLAVESAAIELAASIRGANVTGERRLPKWIVRCKERMEDDLARPPSIRDLARDVGVHPVYLARTFRRWFRTSPADYLRRARARRAAHLLLREATRRSLADIALECGYADQASFSKAFHREWGLPPGEFRSAR